MTKLIPIGKHAHALVDDGDYEALSQRKWHLTNGYAATSRFKEGKIALKMHRMILQPPEGKECDHKNGNKLDNRRANLRICTRKQNSANQKVQAVIKSSRFKGVRFRPERGRWSAYIGNREYLGCYGSEEEAALAYNVAARVRFGEFARLNEVSATGEQEVARKLATHRRRQVYRLRRAAQ